MYNEESPLPSPKYMLNERIKEVPVVYVHVYACRKL
jgi:hypothetical protein